jgi:general secretion pathway protein A
MRQLDQRVSIRYQLRPLNRDEVSAYVSHRLMIAGASASVNFQPKALDMVHRRTGGIPRLVNLVCDRSLLAAYSGRTNRVSADMVYQAAEVAGSMLVPSLRASAAPPADAADGTPGVMAPRVPAALIAQPAARVAAVAPDAPGAPIAPSTTPDARFSVLTASFPVVDLSPAGSAASARLSSVVAQLESLGFDVRLMDVNLGDRGDWRRVLIGEFATLADAKAEVARVHRSAAFSDAQVIRY